MASFTVTEHLVDGQYIREYPRSTATQDARLKLSVKKYTPVDNPNPQPGDVTIIGTHGTGFPKEMYEPLWETLLARSKQDGFRIRAIWAVDVANQGASGVHNEQHLGNDASWLDHSRDLLQMINHFRDEMPRPIFGVGHSVGATQLAFLSLVHPRLFTSLLFIEPYIVPIMQPAGGAKRIKATTRRKDIWPSRSAAEQEARKSLRIWDPRVVDRWVQYGFRDLPTLIHSQPTTNSPDEGPPVTLTTTKHQEAFVYTRANFNRHRQLGLPDQEGIEKANGPRPPHDPLTVPDMIGQMYAGQTFYRPEAVLAMQLVPFLRPPVLYVSGAKSALTLEGGQVQAAQQTGTGFGGSGGMEYGRVKHIIIDRSGHTLPFEKVSATADALGPWLGQQLQQWKTDERRIAEGWESLSLKEKSTWSEEWRAASDAWFDAFVKKKSSSKL
ncbi:hypothetical protein ASPWEDRAFT_51796 [Aspergillus wentii DTO 134E9]|uniref:AB hydrolase-1 domain-containing protein n=1 Tax=Aspergillus wentii DTO 134E9 TaxID=1073089 RepID=A0A1L9RLQ2_ASPWE|nr:uncharacterized protein ASPWEDRAFT_51796 [Aspergillus wentii DTO 134E9]KAI9929696.1 hypothetical protein MW887_001172 [Aspergillus wentii]OJJ35852.1 hypothetical protein ASPWEDRAFT_51796 [Aspergillus wentii DTO 134E9]